MPLKLYNSLTRRHETFEPADGETVKMYSCGPTVYHYAHIGNLRTFTFQDILRRYLRRCGWKLLHVMNITDVDDKIIKNAGEKGLSLTDYTRKYEKAFFEDAAGLRLEKPEKIARATEHIDAMLRLVERIAEKGHTYRMRRLDVFQDCELERLREALAARRERHQSRRPRRPGRNTRKTMPAISRCGKPAGEDEPHWPGPFGAGRPGWHLECSAMAMQYLGETFDIPHRRSRICSFRITRTRSRSRKPRPANSSCAFGSMPSTCWSKDGRCRSRSQFLYAARSAGARFLRRGGALPAVFDSAPQAVELHAGRLERRRGGDRPPAGASSARIAGGGFAAAASPRMSGQADGAREQFFAALDDDLNTAQALGAVFEYIREANSAIDGGTFGQETRRKPAVSWSFSIRSRRARTAAGGPLAGRGGRSADCRPRAGPALPATSLKRTAFATNSPLRE